MTIVGHKIERYLTAVKRDYGGHWDVTHHQIITELHATKGWRESSHERKVHRVRRLPPPDQWRAARVSEYIPNRNRKIRDRVTSYGSPVLKVCP